MARLDVKSVDFLAVAASLGFTLSARDSSQKIKIMHSQDKKIAVYDNGERGFYYVNQKNNSEKGTIIDLVMCEQFTDFIGAKEYIESLNLSSASVREYSKPAANAQELRDLSGAYSKSQSADKCEYLINERRLSADLLAQCADARFGTSSAMFFHKDSAGALTGYEYRSEKSKGFCKGGKKSLFTLDTCAAPRVLVIVESAINTFSYAQLLMLAGKPLEHKIISTAGRYSAAQAEQIKELALAIGGRVTLAHDNDLKNEGDIQADALARMLERSGIESKRHKPQLNDWNDCLIARLERAD